MNHYNTYELVYKGICDIISAKVANHKLKAIYNDPVAVLKEKLGEEFGV